MRAHFMDARKRDLPELEPPAHDRNGLVRVQFLIRLESLINVGCHFGPDDLPATVWDELIAMALERAFVDRLVDEQREKKREVDQKLAQARQAAGTPPPGTSIFPQKRPFR